MHHELLKSCLPLLIALAVLCAIAQIVLRLSGARLHLHRLRDVHRCEAGGVQSLAFVLTLPIFLMVVMFIVQIALVMVGLITVNTAAFAAARAAAVWIPAEVDGEEEQNVVPVGSMFRDTPYTLSINTASECKKFQEIFEAAVLACVPIAPSNSRYSSLNDPVLQSTDADTALVALYGHFVPQSASNTVMPARLQRKMVYSLKNTRVILHYVDKNSGFGPQSVPGPTYNPWHHPTYSLHEVGWQDPMTITVAHDFALLPGPGRFLAKTLTRYDGRTDDVASTIGHSGRADTTELRGSATLTIEGLKSVRPYVQYP